MNDREVLPTRSPTNNALNNNNNIRRAELYETYEHFKH